MGYNDEKLTSLIDQLMAEDRLEQPSKDFTSHIMAKVEHISSTTVTVYKPLISKTAWVIIISALIALVGYIYFNESTGNGGYGLLQNVDLSDLNIFSEVSFDFSNTVLYAVIFLALMLGVQIPLLKNYFNKQLQY